MLCVRETDNCNSVIVDVCSLVELFFKVSVFPLWPGSIHGQPLQRLIARKLTVSI